MIARGGYLVRLEPSGRYLERIPIDNTYDWYAAGQEHATVFTKAAADGWAAMMRQRGDQTRVIEDYDNRTPEIDVEDLDPELFCLRHGKPLLDGEYGYKASNCDDCDPEPPTFDEALGAVCDAREREHAALRLKR